jgi:hypothetical protein
MQFGENSMENQNIETLQLITRIAAYKIIVPLSFALFLLIHTINNG